MQPFHDRREAGRILAARLGEYANRTDVIVLAMPRGGIPVASEVACALNAPMDVFLVQPVYVGKDAAHVATIASGGFEQIDDAAIETLPMSPEAVSREIDWAKQGLASQERMYRAGRPAPMVEGRTVVLVYDGLATGTLMIAAIAALRTQRPARIVVAVPVASVDGLGAVERVADACVAVVTPQPFYRIGIWYEDFAPVSDATALFLLDRGCTASTAAA